MSEDATTARLRRALYRVWFAVGVLVLAAVAFLLLLRPLSIVVAPVLLAMLIVYLLNPAVSWFERRGVPRWAGTGLSYLGAVLVLTGLVALLVPALAAQLRAFVELSPNIGERLVESVNELLGAVGWSGRLDTTLSGEALGLQLQDFLSASENRTAVLAVLGGISGIATGLFHGLLVVVLGPVIAFYLLADLPRLLRLAATALPPARRAEAAAVAHKLGFVVGGYVRGQLLVATFVGVAAFLALSLIGLKFSLVLGLVAGITNLVPLIGPFVAGSLGVLVALSTDGVPQALLVVAALTLVQQVDSHVLSPLVVGRTVRVHPLAVLLALLVAGTLYGIFGMVIAVPLVAGAKVLVQHAWTTRVPWARDVALLQEEASGPAAARPEGPADRLDPHSGEPTPPELRPIGP